MAKDRAARIERRLKLHDLRVLMAVVQGGSMSRAAERLATSQPAISRAIADLEHSLGVRLLDRGPQGVAATPYGHALIRRGIAMFDELRLGVKDLEFLADPSAGEVRIAAPIALSTGFIAAVIDKLTRRHPRVVCELMVDESPRVFGRLEAREVDVAINFAMTGLAEDRMDAEPLYTDPLVIVASARNPLTRRRGIKLADLLDQPWTFPPPGSALRDVTDGAFHAAGLDPPAPMVASTSAPARLALAARGRFLTVTTASVFRFAGKDMALKLLPVRLPVEPRIVSIVTLKNRTLTPVAQLFIACARDVARPMAGRTSARRAPERMW